MVIKFVHVMIAVTLAGLSFASCFYVAQSRSSQNAALYQFTLRLALFLEGTSNNSRF